MQAVLPCKAGYKKINHVQKEYTTISSYSNAFDSMWDCAQRYISKDTNGTARLYGNEAIIYKNLNKDALGAAPQSGCGIFTTMPIFSEMQTW